MRSCRIFHHQQYDETRAMEHIGNEQAAQVSSGHNLLSQAKESTKLPFNLLEHCILHTADVRIGGIICIPT